MMRRIAFVVSALACAAAGRAEDQPALSFHGFASQAFEKTSDNRVGTAPTEKGTFALSEAALSLTWQPSSRLRIGAQLFGNDFGSEGNNRVTIDWALGDYRWRDWLGLRAGRIKLPNGLYSIVVDADVARPEVLQPQGAYNSANRDLAVAFDGLDAYGIVGLGKAGDLEYEAWGGTADLDRTIAIRHIFTESAISILPALPITQGDYSVNTEGIEAPTNWLFGGALEWRPPVTGLRLRASAERGDVDVDGTTLFSGFAGQFPVVFQSRNQTHVDSKVLSVLSAEFQRNGLRLSSEYYFQNFDTRSTINGLGFPIAAATTNHPGGWYVQAAYTLTPRFQADAYYSALYTDRTDKDGAAFVARGLPAHRGYQKELVAGARFDVLPNWLVKAEVHDVHGTAGAVLSEQPHGVAGLKKDWWQFVARTTFHF